MKKFYCLLLLSFSVFASPKDALNSRLAMNKGFSADFTQKVISPDGDLLMQGKGRVDIARPDMFRWSTTSPDENLLVSDGKSLWYYTPSIQQLTIYNPQKAIQQTPFILLTRNQPSDWDNYKVTQKGNVFTLTSTAKDSNQGTYQIDINAKGIVKDFNVKEQDGQQSLFSFNNVVLKTPKLSEFTFTAPKGVEVDDQRN
ncbi:outer membrane lipoprotein chaperone LolA [Vibrio sp. S4M6]|uniref:outer membrane lipoprotein chaperone LolA n=1 Tax=Vibrio sinus TaxID=2946865 RepID=UPI00202A6ECA|nr:outer membrane lipoprotein chaperone LolA [Vibrio sinus]MCL9783025.1 outer membrane lipoprotein chaperone LolA [Vibrio sinus]